jgi:Mce-associated membrane protein
MSRTRTVPHDTARTAAAETGGDEPTPADTESATDTASKTTSSDETMPAAAAMTTPSEASEAAETGEAEAGEAETGGLAPEPGEAEVETEVVAAAGPTRPRPVWRRLPVLLLAAAVLLTGVGVWFTFEARSAAANPAAANLALTDVGATADVTSAVTVAMNQIFSYSYDRTDVTEKAAAAVLRGAAKDSYDKLFAEVRRKAPEQKLVLSSRVSAIAVQDLRNGHARLLVFLDQSAVRADNNATDSAAAQLSVTAERSDGHWVVTALEPR